MLHYKTLRNIWQILDKYGFLYLKKSIYCPKFAKCSLRFYNASQINSPHKYKTSIGGIIPTDQDVLAKNYFFTKEFNEEEIVLITNVGAYTLTFSNRFPYGLPNIFLVKNKDVEQIFNTVIDHDFSLV